MVNWTESNSPHPDMHAPLPEPTKGPDVITEAPAPVEEAPSQSPTRQRRWPRLVLLALVGLLIGAGGGVGVSILTTTPTRDHLRTQRDALQGQLDQAHDDLITAQTAAAVSKTKSAACQRLATDSKVMVDDWDQIIKMWDDPANQNVVSGSAQDAQLSRKFDDLVSSMTFTRGLVTSDAASCDSTATTL